VRFKELKEMVMGKAYRWLGFIPTARKGMLHIKRADGKVRVVAPANIEEGITRSCIISDQADFDALGEARIAEFLAAGYLEPVKIAEGIFDFLKPEPKPLDLKTGEGSLAVADFTGAEVIAQETAAFEAEWESLYAIPKRDENGQVIHRDDLRGLHSIGSSANAHPVVRKPVQSAYGGSGGTGAGPKTTDSATS
jgi:hypothetical protein